MSPRARGAIRLAGEVVDHGAGAIERVHLATAARTFAILEMLPVVAGPARIVRAFHTLATKASYGSVRIVARAVTAIALAVTPGASPRR